MIHFLEQRHEGGVTAEQREERRLVSDGASKEVGTCAGQPKRDRSAERVADHPRRHEPEVLDQRSEVGHVLANAALSGGALALAVSAAVIGKDPEGSGQARNDQVPVVVGVPGPRTPISMPRPPSESYETCRFLRAGLARKCLKHVQKLRSVKCVPLP
jgi:hypothetical protein